MNLRTLITGGSGLLAMNWAYSFRDEHDICLVTHNHTVAIPGVESVSINLEHANEILCLFERFQPDVIVHAAGFTNVDGCERSPDIAMEINAELAGKLAQLAHNNYIAFVQISTDQMFKGELSFSTEQDALAPINAYGKSKCEAERLVFRNAPNALVIRTNFYGWGHRKRTSITDWVIQTVGANKTIKAFEDVFFTPIFVDDLVAAIYELLDCSATGIFNVVGDERVSKYNFSFMVAEVFKLQKSHIAKSHLSDMELLAKRPLDMSLSNEKLVKFLERNMGGVLEGLEGLLSTQGRQVHLNASLLDK